MSENAVLLPPTEQPPNDTPPSSDENLSDTPVDRALRAELASYLEEPSEAPDAAASANEPPPASAAPAPAAVMEPATPPVVEPPPPAQEQPQVRSVRDLWPLMQEANGDVDELLLTGKVNKAEAQNLRQANADRLAAQQLARTEAENRRNAVDQARPLTKAAIKKDVLAEIAASAEGLRAINEDRLDIDIDKALDALLDDLEPVIMRPHQLELQAARRTPELLPYVQADEQTFASMDPLDQVYQLINASYRMGRAQAGGAASPAVLQQHKAEVDALQAQVNDLTARLTGNTLPANLGGEALRQMSQQLTVEEKLIDDDTSMDDINALLKAKGL